MKKTTKLINLLLITLITSACSSKALPLVLEDDVVFSVPYPNGNNQFVFEYAQQDVTLKEHVIIYGSGKLFLEIPEIDTNKVGETEYIIKSNLEDYVVSVLIEDTHQPIISGETTFTIQEGESLNLSEKLTAEDSVDGVLDVTFDKSDFSKAGEHTVIASATDTNGNVTTETVTITVIAKPKPVIQKPTTNPTPVPPKPITPNPTPSTPNTTSTPPEAIKDKNPNNSSRVPDKIDESGWVDFYYDTHTLSDGTIITQVLVQLVTTEVSFMGTDMIGDKFFLTYNIEPTYNMEANSIYVIGSRMPTFGDKVLYGEFPPLARTYMAYYE
jgi:hypothetical protein